MKARFKYCLYRCNHGGVETGLVIDTCQDDPARLSMRRCPVCGKDMEIWIDVK